MIGKDIKGGLERIERLYRLTEKERSEGYVSSRVKDVISSYIKFMDAKKLLKERIVEYLEIQSLFSMDVSTRETWILLTGNAIYEFLSSYDSRYAIVFLHILNPRVPEKYGRRALSNTNLVSEEVLLKEMLMYGLSESSTMGILNRLVELGLIKRSRVRMYYYEPPDFMEFRGGV